MTDKYGKLHTDGSRSGGQQPDEKTPPDWILIEAAFALERHERLRKEMRHSEERLRQLCRQYDQAAGTRGFAPHHLAQACKARGLMV